MNTEQPTEIKQPTLFETKTKEWEDRATKLESDVAFCRAWITAHAAIIAPFDWDCMGWSRELVFNQYGARCVNAREIATAFGKEGWKRVPDRYTCGKIDWMKSVDGMLLKIESAEHLPMNVREDVRL